MDLNLHLSSAKRVVTEVETQCPRTFLQNRKMLSGIWGVHGCISKRRNGPHVSGLLANAIRYRSTVAIKNESIFLKDMSPESLPEGNSRVDTEDRNNSMVSIRDQ